eukprot:5031505-Amphidinium_carterae.1
MILDTACGTARVCVHAHGFAAGFKSISGPALTTLGMEMDMSFRFGGVLTERSLRMKRFVAAT